jgi:nuclear pore complex protein Nup155
MLRQKCPTFCSPNDVTLYKGIEHLQRSNHVTSGLEKTEHLAESLRLFSNVADKLDFSKLEEIVASYKSLKYRTGVVNLVLLVAKKSDPANLALIFLGVGSGDMKAKEIYKKRVGLYGLIFDMISSLESVQGLFIVVYVLEPERSEAEQEIYESMLSSDDKVFHYALYEWLITNGYRDRIALIKTPYIEEYLMLGRSDLVIADILWSFYASNSSFEKMAKVLSDLANSTNQEYDLNLERRMEYLARGIAAAKSSRPGAGVEYGALLHDLEDSSDVAEIQRDIRMLLEGDEEAVRDLDFRLLDISELYNLYASRYEMHEVVLAVFYTSGHKDRLLIEKTWKALIANGLSLWLMF